MELRDENGGIVDLVRYRISVAKQDILFLRKGEKQWLHSMTYWKNFPIGNRPHLDDKSPPLKSTL